MVHLEAADFDESFRKNNIPNRPSVSEMLLEATTYLRLDVTPDNIRNYTLRKYGVDVAEHINDSNLLTRTSEIRLPCLYSSTRKVRSRPSRSNTGKIKRTSVAVTQKVAATKGRPKPVCRVKRVTSPVCKTAKITRKIPNRSTAKTRTRATDRVNIKNSSFVGLKKGKVRPKSVKAARKVQPKAERIPTKNSNASLKSSNKSVVKRSATSSRNAKSTRKVLSKNTAKCNTRIKTCCNTDAKGNSSSRLMKTRAASTNKNTSIRKIPNGKIAKPKLRSVINTKAKNSSSTKATKCRLTKKNANRNISVLNSPKRKRPLRKNSTVAKWIESIPNKQRNSTIQPDTKLKRELELKRKGQGACKNRRKKSPLRKREIDPRMDTSSSISGGQKGSPNSPNRCSPVQNLPKMNELLDSSETINGSEKESSSYEEQRGETIMKENNFNSTQEPSIIENDFGIFTRDQTDVSTEMQESVKKSYSPKHKTNNDKLISSVASRMVNNVKYNASFRRDDPVNFRRKFKNSVCEYKRMDGIKQGDVPLDKKIIQAGYAVLSFLENVGLTCASQIGWSDTELYPDTDNMKSTGISDNNHLAKSIKSCIEKESVPSESSVTTNENYSDEGSEQTPDDEISHDSIPDQLNTGDDNSGSKDSMEKSLSNEGQLKVADTTTSSEVEFPEICDEGSSKEERYSKEDKSGAKREETSKKRKLSETGGEKTVKKRATNRANKGTQKKISVSKKGKSNIKSSGKKPRNNIGKRQSKKGSNLSETDINSKGKLAKKLEVHTEKKTRMKPDVEKSTTTTTRNVALTRKKKTDDMSSAAVGKKSKNSKAENTRTNLKGTRTVAKRKLPENFEADLSKKMPKRSSLKGENDVKKPRIDRKRKIFNNSKVDTEQRKKPAKLEVDKVKRKTKINTSVSAKTKMPKISQIKLKNTTIKQLIVKQKENEALARKRKRIVNSKTELVKKKPKILLNIEKRVETVKKVLSIAKEKQHDVLEEPFDERQHEESTPREINVGLGKMTATDIGKLPENFEAESTTIEEKATNQLVAEEGKIRAGAQTHEEQFLKDSEKNVTTTCSNSEPLKRKSILVKVVDLNGLEKGTIGDYGRKLNSAKVKKRVSFVNKVCFVP